MKLTIKLLVLFFGVLMLANFAYAESPREEFKQMIVQLQKSPEDNSLREKIITLAQTLKPAPALPIESERLEGRAQYAFKNAKTEAEMLNAAREYLKAVDAAPWVAGYYFDLCTILEKANRPAEAIRACKFYLIAAPDAPDASDVRKRVAGFEYGLEQLRNKVSRRQLCGFSREGMYLNGSKVAQIGAGKIILKLYSTLNRGEWRNQLSVWDISNNRDIFGQFFDLDPNDNTFRLDDRVQGTPWYRLTISREGRITFGGSGSTQAEIVTSIAELHQMRNAQLNDCVNLQKDGKFFVPLPQGGSAESKNGFSRAGLLFFDSDCAGNLIGDKPGWFPSVFEPFRRENLEKLEDLDRWLYAQGFRLASADACQQSSNDGLGWLTP